MRGQKNKTPSTKKRIYVIQSMSRPGLHGLNLHIDDGAPAQASQPHALSKAKNGLWTTTMKHKMHSYITKVNLLLGGALRSEKAARQTHPVNVV